MVIDEFWTELSSTICVLAKFESGIACIHNRIQFNKCKKVSKMADKAKDVPIINVFYLTPSGLIFFF